MQHQPAALARGNPCWRQGDRAGSLAAYRQAIRQQPLFGVPYRNPVRLLGPPGELLLELAAGLEEAELGFWRLVSRAAPENAELAAEPAEQWLRCGIAQG
jgi:hypothetical protein